MLLPIVAKTGAHQSTPESECEAQAQELKGSIVGPDFTMEFETGPGLQNKLCFLP